MSIAASETQLNHSEMGGKAERRHCNAMQPHTLQAPVQQAGTHAELTHTHLHTHTHTHTACSLIITRLGRRGGHTDLHSVFCCGGDVHQNKPITGQRTYLQILYWVISREPEDAH